MSLQIKEILKRKGITQIELAEKLGVSKMGMNKIINGNPTIETLKKIADALDIGMRELFAFEGEPKKEKLYKKIDGKFVEVGEIKSNT